MREYLGYVAESDLDLMLVLDARSGGPLTRYLLKRVGATPNGPVTAARSTLRCAGTRETDVEVTWDGGALLIEDKVDAAFTPGQPDSYVQEVTERRARNEDVWAVLVCPARMRAYYEPQAKGAFNPIVTCEELAREARTHGDRLSLAAAIVFEAAAEARPGPAVDPARSAWGDLYRTLVSELVPPGDQLDPGPKSLRTSTAEWMYFRSGGIDPPEVWSFGHWVPSGQVRMDLMVQVPPHSLPVEAELVRKPTMWWVQLHVPPLTFDEPPTAQRPALDAAIEGALALRRWAAASPWQPA